MVKKKIVTAGDVRRDVKACLMRVVNKDEDPRPLLRRLMVRKKYLPEQVLRAIAELAYKEAERMKKERKEGIQLILLEHMEPLAPLGKSKKRRKTK